MQIRIVLIRSIIVFVLVFFPVFVCAGTLKPPFRLLWERKQTIARFCNNKCIQFSKYGFDVIDPLTGKVSLSRQFRSDFLTGCNEQREFSASLLGLKQANVISFPQNDKEGPGSDERKPKTDRSNR